MLRLWLLWIPSTRLIICQLWENAITVDVMGKRGLPRVPVYSLENRMRCVVSREKGVNDSRKMPADGF